MGSGDEPGPFIMQKTVESQRKSLKLNGFSFGGDGGIRTHGPLRIKRFRVVLVMTTSIRLRRHSFEYRISIHENQTAVNENFSVDSFPVSAQAFCKGPLDKYPWVVYCKNTPWGYLKLGGKYCGRKQLLLLPQDQGAVAG